MQFSKAHLAVLDPESYRYRDTDVVLAAGKKGQDGRQARTWVEMNVMNHQYGPHASHEIRYYSGHVEPGCEGPTLQAWHEVWGGSLTAIGQLLVLTGFAQGTQGRIWPGHPDPNNWDEHFDFTQPFVGIEWALTP